MARPFLGGGFLTSTSGGGSGTVTEVTGSGPISVANGTSTPAITFTGSQGHAIYGDGSDGAGTISGSTTLTRDTFYTTLVVQNGGTLNTANARVLARTSVTVESGGAIRNDGPAGAANGTAGTSPASITVNKTAGSGGAGGTAGGTAGTNVTVALGGAGGAGGNGSGGSGGSGGTATAPVVARSAPRFLPFAIVGGAQLFNTAVDSYSGGAGGGGGGGDGTAGGGGGAGAGVMLLCSPSIDIQAGGLVSCAGGNGGTPAAGNRGGGGGGGGGLVILIYDSLAETVAVSVAGGTKGVKSGTGTDGVDGSIGTVVRLKNSAG